MTDRTGQPPLHLQLAGPAARPHGHPDHAVIVDQLVIGEYPTPEDAEWLRRERAITAVVCLQDEIDLDRKGLSLRALERAYAGYGLHFHRVAVPDGDLERLRERLDEVVALVAELIRRGERIYLHCNAGLNRAPTVAIAYLHVHADLTLEAACALVKARRPCVPYMRLLSAHYRAER